QMVLGPHVQQKGSNITPERLRFDFSHPEKMTPGQIKQVEEIVNDVIQRNLPVTMETMTIEEAKAKGATALFTAKYGEQVKVYATGDFSMEVCGGPHAAATGELGGFKIKKEESSSAGVRRIKAVITAKD
ncbi:MAG TPA: alanine--tRNA ligase, partial [Kiritimatiellia bacterium]|nr:alanine--tRNA ligase [Kiritimatiellia bacterium]HPK37673.1 alanine--tRNA ligase [Kiritimatiellia bacterium]